MSTAPSWIPELILLDDYQGNWERYLNTLYFYFRRDFIDTGPIFEGKSLAVKVEPIYDGKEGTFWHIISDGNIEVDRTPDLRRCERIQWPKPIIENSSDLSIRIWENQRNNEKRVCIYLEACEYLVVISRRRGYNLFWTAYPITYEHTKRKLIKEYESYRKANAA